MANEAMTGYAPELPGPLEISRGLPQAPEPLRPAPARFGVAGLSAGATFKTRIPHDPARRRKMAGDRIAKGLGWFSLALGATEVLCGRSLARWLGMENATWLLRAYGLREITTGVGILAAHRPEDRSPWMWARAGGDALDLATLSPGLHPSNPHRDRVAATMTAVAAITTLDTTTALLTLPSHPPHQD